MATNFKNALIKDVGTVRVPVYTSPPSTKTTIIGLSMANVTSSVVSGSLLLGSGTESTVVYLIKDVAVAPNSTLKPIGKGEKIVLQAGDILYAESDTTDALDIVVSTVEIV